MDRRISYLDLSGIADPLRCAQRLNAEFCLHRFSVSGLRLKLTLKRINCNEYFLEATQIVMSYAVKQDGQVYENAFVNSRQYCNRIESEWSH